MKNVTITLPDELAHRAKVLAAERNTSVSRYVGQLLAERLEAEDGFQRAREAWKCRKPMVLNEAGARYPSRDDVHER